MVSEPAIREALAGVIDPELRRSVVELDMVRAVDVRERHVDVTIALTVAGCPMKADLESQVRGRVGAVEGVESVGVSFDVMTPEQRTALRTTVASLPLADFERPGTASVRGQDREARLVLDLPVAARPRRTRVAPLVPLLRTAVPRADLRMDDAHVLVEVAFTVPR